MSAVVPKWTDVDRTRVDIAPDVTPRRRRNGAVCGSLRVDGQPMTFDDFAALGVRFTPGAANGTRLNLLELRCTERHEAVGSGWVEDICTSSWQRDCPFKVASEAARPAVHCTPAVPAPAVTLPSPAPVRNVPEQERRKALARRIRSQAADRGLSLHDVSIALGHRGNYATTAVRELQPGPLQRIAAYLETIPKLPPPKPVAFSEMSPEMHAARIRAAIEALGMTYFDASRIIRMGDSFVANVLRRLGPLDRLEELDAVLDAMLAASS